MAKVTAMIRKNNGGKDYWTRAMGNVGNSGSLRFSSSGSGINSNTQLVEDCWINHAGEMHDQGRVSTIVDIQHAGKTFRLKSSSPMTWSGDSGSSNQSGVNLVIQ
ncbi:hypothetical protein [Morganella morganii]|uniref:hypothetical protein n=1 Tax=Morganella morganii TaxID=582 RepID=UPI003EBB98F8